MTAFQFTCRAVALAWVLALAPFSSVWANNDPTIDHLIDVSGVGRQINEIPGRMVVLVKQLEQEEGVLPPEAFSIFEQAVMTHFTEQTFRQAVHDRLREKFSDKGIERVTEWFDKEPGAKIKALENEPLPSDFNTIQNTAANFADDATRMAHVHALIDALDVVRIAADNHLNPQAAMLTIMQRVQAPDENVSFRRTKAQLSESSSDIEQRIRPVVETSLLYTYRDLSNRDMERYVTFAESTAARKYLKVAFDGLSRAFDQASQNAARQLSQGLADLEVTSGL